MLWTAVGIWIEPLRSTFDYGQINVLLVLAVLCAVYSSRWWLSGLLVGLAAGVKLTPAVAGLYFVGARRWGAAVFSAVVFVAHGRGVGCWWSATRPATTSPTCSATPTGSARSARRSTSPGAAGSRGSSATTPGTAPLVLAALVVTAVLALLAWRASAPTTASAASSSCSCSGCCSHRSRWTHHWVWLLPLMIWLLHGPLRERTGARVLGWGWLVLTLVGVPWLLSFAQPTIWEIGRPWYLAWAGLVYVGGDAGDAGAGSPATGRRSALMIAAPSRRPCR